MLRQDLFLQFSFIFRLKGRPFSVRGSIFDVLRFTIIAREICELSISRVVQVDRNIIIYCDNRDEAPNNGDLVREEALLLGSSWEINRNYFLRELRSLVICVRLLLVMVVVNS